MNKLKKHAIGMLIVAAAFISSQPAVAEIALQPSANGEVTLVVNFEVKPGAEAEFEEIFRRSVTQSRQEPGNILFNVHKVIGAERSYVLYEIWRDEAAVKFHFAQPYTVALFSMFERNLARPLTEGGLRFIQDLDPQPRPAPAKAKPIVEPAATLELPDRFHPGSAALAPDGRLFVSSITTGRTMVFAPGGKTPSDFIDVAKSGVDSAMGIKVDAARSRLWACTASFGLDQTPGNHPAALLAFDLLTGDLLQTLPLPNGGLANDFVIARNGAIVVTDSFTPRLLVLRPGATALEELLRDEAFAPPAGGFGLDGVIELADGSLLLTKNTTGELLRVTDPFGKAPTITKLTTSRPLAGADGLALGADGRIYLGEPDFGGTNGRVDVITLDGSSARIETIAEGLATPLGVILSPDGFWPIEGRMGPVLNPDRKNEEPGKMRLVFRPQP